MDLKRLITHFTYRIEPKPEGGFIARAEDPSQPAIEAPAREELQRKIQSNIAAGLAAEFPALKPTLENKGVKFAFHIERAPTGGFIIHSADPNAAPINGGSHAEIESHFAEKLIAFVGKHLMPEVSQALTAAGNSGDIKVFVDRRMGFTAASPAPSLSIGPDSAPAGPGGPGEVKLEDANLAPSSFGNQGVTINNSAITPQSNSSWTIFRFLLTLLIIAALLYFFVHRH